MEEQPRYLVFMCCQVGNLSSAQTVLVDMKEVYARLTEEEVYILKRTRYAGSEEAAPILRTDNYGRNIFSFRDFYPEPLHWSFESNGRAYSVQDINNAIEQLLLNMYSATNCAGISWEQGRLVILDNTFFFHGKQASDQIDYQNTRHLKRLRVINKK